MQSRKYKCRFQGDYEWEDIRAYSPEDAAEEFVEESGSECTRYVVVNGVGTFRVDCIYEPEYNAIRINK